MQNEEEFIRGLRAEKGIIEWGIKLTKEEIDDVMKSLDCTEFKEIGQIVYISSTVQKQSL